MTHPEDLLAAYVGDALGAAERAAVDGHLASCARCRRDTGLAREARNALVSLAEVPAPAGVASRALHAADRPAPTPAAARPRWQRAGWQRVAAVVGVAAAVALAFAVLPKLGSPSQKEAAPAAASVQAPGGAAGTTSRAPLGLEIQSITYDDAALLALAGSFAPSAGPTMGTSAAVQTAPATQGKTNVAVACVRKAAPEATGTLTRLIRATYQSSQVYLAVFLSGPGAGQQPDTADVWVVKTADCTPVGLTTAKI